MEFNSYLEDPEFIAFENWMVSKKKSKATMKSYRANYRKLRNFLGEKAIEHSAQDTCIKAIQASVTNPNSQAALLNVAYLV